MTERITAQWCGTSLTDMLGKPFQVGDTIARAVTSGRASNLQIATVTRIEDGKLYLSESKVAINYPSRLLIINETYSRRMLEVLESLKVENEL